MNRAEILKKQYREAEALYALHAAVDTLIKDGAVSVLFKELEEIFKIYGVGVFGQCELIAPEKVRFYYPADEKELKTEEV